MNNQKDLKFNFRTTEKCNEHLDYIARMTEETRGVVIRRLIEKEYIRLSKKISSLPID